MLKNVKRNMKDWKDDILNSTDGMKKANPSSAAFDQILLKINSQDHVTEHSLGWMAIAATISLIILINTYFLATYSSDTASPPPDSEPAYSSLVTNFNLYENNQ